VIPDGYAVANGLQSAMLAIQAAKDKNDKPALQVCKKDSIQKALLEVVQNGLYLNKSHGYMVVMGDQLVLLTSYMGEVYKAKQNDKNLKDIYAEIVYEGDVFRYAIKQGHKVVTTHEQEPDNINPAKIKGAYATAIYKDGTEVSDYMPLDQIKKSWQMGQSKGTSKAHLLATDEMCRKTVLRRLAKMINATNNDSLYEEAVNEIESEIDSNENSGIIDITPDGDFSDSGSNIVGVADDCGDDIRDCGSDDSIDDPFEDL